MKKDIFKKTAERLGWDVSDCDENSYEISCFSPAGQDVNFNIDVSDEDDIVSNVHCLYECYDPSEEAYLWLGSDGHGKKGAPYDMRDILEDMEWVENELRKLYDELYKEEYR